MSENKDVGYKSISDHGLIRNMRSAVLVTKDGYRHWDRVEPLSFRVAPTSFLYDGGSKCVWNTRLLTMGLD